jgi:dihydropteroate synthase
MTTSTTNRSLRHRAPDASGPALVMGILNVTPDSFSDGGDYASADAAADRAAAMIREGAAIVDVGPESTRPGAEPVPANEQIRRAIPVIERVRSRFAEVCLSIDTSSSVVARAALAPTGSTTSPPCAATRRWQRWLPTPGRPWC